MFSDIIIKIHELNFLNRLPEDSVCGKAVPSTKYGNYFGIFT
jgi:hypothetical protein